VNPSLSLPFSDEYFEVSMHISKLAIPSTCNLYLPDNDDFFSCRVVIQPAPERGAPVWTTPDGKRALLGVYRDEGRPAQIAPFSPMTWVREGSIMTVTVPATAAFKPYFAAGDSVNINAIGTITAVVLTTALSSTQAFTISVPDAGPLSGAGLFQGVKPVNFFDDYVVFRQLPNMKPLKISKALELLASYSAFRTNKQELLTDPVTGLTIAATVKEFNTVRLANGGQAPAINRQQFNELNVPLLQAYDARGRLISPKTRYTKKQNAQHLLEAPNIGSTALGVYDYYGFYLNDVARAPFNTASLITYDSSAVDGLSRQLGTNGLSKYSGLLFDQFGLVVTGAFSSNRLKLEDPILPLRVDQFNVPFKASTRNVDTGFGVANPVKFKLAVTPGVYVVAAYSVFNAKKLATVRGEFIITGYAFAIGKRLSTNKGQFALSGSPALITTTAVPPIIIKQINLPLSLITGIIDSGTLGKVWAPIPSGTLVNNSIIAGGALTISGARIETTFSNAPILNFILDFKARKTIDGPFGGHDAVLASGSDGGVTSGFVVELSSVRGFRVINNTTTNSALLISYMFNPNDGLEHHYVYSRIGTISQLKIDNIIVATSAYSQPIATASGLLAIGAYSSSGLYPFTGAIRDFSLSYTN
jgi:hypothetical protein